MTPSGSHPLDVLLNDWLPQCDFAVLRHGFAAHGRDYVMVIEVGGTSAARSGTYELAFTHVTALVYETRVRDDVWPASWDDRFIDYDTWIGSGEPDGYVWGSNWSLAYPGIAAIRGSPVAAEWTTKIGKPFFEATLETDRFFTSLVFHTLLATKISDETDLIDQIVIPSR